MKARKKKSIFAPNFTKLTENNRCQYWIRENKQCGDIGTTKKTPKSKSFCVYHYNIMDECQKLYQLLTKVIESEKQAQNISTTLTEENEKEPLENENLIREQLLKLIRKDTIV